MHSEFGIRGSVAGAHAQALDRAVQARGRLGLERGLRVSVTSRREPAQGAVPLEAGGRALAGRRVMQAGVGVAPVDEVGAHTQRVAPSTTRAIGALDFSGRVYA